MTGNVRPETMERITTKALADAFIEKQIKKIRAQVGDINRVFMDITPKPIGTIEFE